jgi:hypothetical protein
VYELLSVPVTVKSVAFFAATVKVDELPRMIDVGFALMLTVGVGITVTVAVADAVPPIPVAVAV